MISSEITTIELSNLQQNENNQTHEKQEIKNFILCVILFIGINLILIGINLITK